MASTVFVNSVTLSQAAWMQDADNVVYQYLSGVAGTNTITATGPAGLGAYAAGLKFRFIPAATNTGATTINITGTAALGARNIFYNGVACVGGELRIGIPVEITDDGTQFHITSLATLQGTWTPSIGGSATYTTQTGTFTKIGRLVFVNCVLLINVIGTGSTSVISGLPFAPAATVSLCIGVASILAASVVSVTCNVAGASTNINLRSRTAASASDAVNAIIGSGSLIEISGCYEV